MPPSGDCIGGRNILIDPDTVMQASPTTGLPQADEASRAHSARVAEFLSERIADAGGSISFAEYMQHALYAGGLGYYAAGSAKFGSAGDFVTAPEVSPLFGRVVARQCTTVIESIPDAAILELGAGSGRFAIDILGKLAELDCLPLEYRILEVSPELAERQRRAIEAELPALCDRVRWLDRLPDDHRGVILGNEVLDALPVERFVRRDEVRRLAVVARGDGFGWAEVDAPELLKRTVEAIEASLGYRLPDGYTSEVCLALPGFIGDVVASLEDGVAVFFDYGYGERDYYAPERRRGTLRCHFRHHAHDDPLILPGIQDITAWVDFSAAAAAAVKAGATVLGYTTQAGFVLAGGIAEELADLDAAGDAARLELSRQVKMLTLPGEMGERFHCLGLSRGAAPAPPALVAADRTHTL